MPHPTRLPIPTTAMDSQDYHQTQEMTSPSSSPASHPSLSILNPNPERIPGPSFLHDLVRTTSPNHLPALDYQAASGSREAVSYPELHSRSDDLARRILAALPKGHEKEQLQLVVPLLLSQCPELYISQLAVLKAGGAFCPLNLDAPPERVRFIFRDVSARVVVTSKALRPKVDAIDSSVAVVVVDESDAHDATEQGVEAFQDISPDSLAYVMYTSGSTGTPKGVGISHDAATQALLAHDRHIPPFSRFLQFAAPTFDVSVFEIFFPIFRGSTLVSCNRADMLNDLPGVLRGMRVDACELTPTVAGSLLRSRENAPHLRVLLTIGEMLTEPVIKEFGGDADKPSMLWAMYGPTEATIHCTLQPACEASSSPNNVGFPLDTVSAFILEPLLEDGGSGGFKVLPRGELGELAVGGHQTAVGYINRREQTSKVFIDTPYGRLYRTGDKARMKEDGTMECFGRIADGQVKLRGQRIELGEIEQAVLRAPGCHGAVASVVRGIIVVFCERDWSGDDETNQVLQTCRDWLPAFMVPGDIVFTEAFPRLPSGKVDRKKLKYDYEASKDAYDDSPSEFKDDIERELALLVAEVLGSQLKPSSTLSAAGVDSLAAIRLASRLRRAGFVVNAIDVLNCKTLSHLRSRIRRKRIATSEMTKVEDHSVEREDDEEISGAASSLGVQVEAIEAVVPCAPMQISMLAETLNNPEAYCNWIEIQVPATHAPETIASWFQELAHCNEILRTGFVALQSKFRQVICKRLDPSQISTVKRLSRTYQLNERGFFRPFSVQILGTKSHKSITVLLQIHHALYDGWSFDVLLADLNVLARGHKLVKRPPFRLVSDHYTSPEFFRQADFARGFWAEHLLGFQPTPMPQLVAKQISSGQIFSAQRTLDVGVSDIQAVSTQLDISPQVLFQVCLLWLWSSILGTDDVVIGNVTSGRTIPVDGIEEVIGPCLTTIPLRARLAQVRTIKELLETIHASNRESLAHCTLPLADIKKAAGIAPGQPLYDALFVYQESIASRASQQQPAGQVQQVAHQDYLETKLLAEIEPTDKGFQLRVTYHADVFHYGYMQLLLRQFECVLAHISKNVDLGVESIATSFPNNLASIYNRTPKTLTGCSDLATSFERTAARQPKKTAVCVAKSIDDDSADLESISYRDLNSLANKIARHLEFSGVSEAHPVAIIMEKSIMLYAGILGILKAGCAYLPLLPSTPKARIQTILSQAEVRFCVSDEMSGQDLPELNTCDFIRLRDVSLKHYDGRNQGTITKPSRIANIIYTSGSTGIPKGVCVTQLNICSNLDVLSRIYPVKENSRMLQACSQAFDVSVFEILFALTRGMCLCAATNDTLFANLERSIRVLDVTHLSMTPTVASLVEPANVPRVNFLVTSGEPMTSEVAGKWMGKLYQGYGPSETTNICSVKRMTPEDHIRHLGHTFENTSAFVLHPGSLDILPIGCAGELCFGGDQVVAGYLNLPSVTREKFVDHPRFGRIYRSGDIGRMLADGSLLIVGRVDDQVKLRGQRIELGEINNVVAACSEVVKCVTMLLGEDSAQQLACFYVPVSVDSGTFQLLPAGGKVGRKSEAVYSTLRARLPGYMVPSYLVPISTVPMTSSGKVDRPKLREVFANLGPRELEALSSHVEKADADGDWSEHECKIAAVVADALAVPIQDAGRWTPLTSLGLDSISAIRVAKGLQRAFSRRLTISAILQNPCVAKLGAIIFEQQMAVEKDGKLLDVFSNEFLDHVEQGTTARGLEIEKVLPCTPLQEAMLASSTNNTSYLNKMLFRLNIDAVAMREYWSAMFQRHGILRTCFFSTSDREFAIAQGVLKIWEPEWLSFDAPDGSLDGTIRKHAETVPAAIDSCSPPLSLATIKAGNDTYLSFVCHHAMYDGVGITRLLEEIELLACGSELQAAPGYEPILKEILALPTSTDKFWRKHLQNSRPAPLPRVSETQDGRDVLTQVLDIPFSKIDASLKALNISLLNLLQSSWGTLLRVVLQSDDICFGNVVNGRSGTVDRVDELVAPCFNTIPMRFDYKESKRNVDVMKSFQSLSPELLQYQFTPLRRIQSLCITNGSRLFDTLLLLQQPPRPLDETLWTLERDDGEMDFPLVCEVIPDPGQDRLEVKLHFDRFYISNSFASLIHDTLSHVISTFLYYPSSHTVSRASLPSALRDKLDSLDLIYPTIAIEEDSLQADASEGWTELEKTIRTVFSKISKVKEERITRHMTIFQLGLDSINAIQVAAMLRKEGITGVTAIDVLENPSCSMLVSNTVSPPGRDDTVQYDLVGFQQNARNLLQHSVPGWDAIEAVLPCTALQMGILTEFVNSSGKDYLNFVRFRVDAGITACALRNAWASVVKTHPILRTGFAPLDHEDSSFAMLQYIFRDEDVPVQIQNNTTKFDQKAWHDTVSRAMLDNLRHPPWQAVLVDGAAGVEMNLAIHHVVYDAQSLQRILSDMTKALGNEQLLSGTDVSTAVQHIITETQQCRKTAQEFWKRQAASTVINKFPVMTPLREEKRDILVKSVSCSLSPTALEDAVKNAGFTVQAVAQAAWLRILSCYVGESSIVFGTILSGRSAEAARDAVFPCIATLPVIGQHSSSNAKLLRSMMQYNIELQRYQRTPLTDVQRWLGHPNTKLFDTLLVYQKFQRDETQRELWSITDEQATVDYPISLEIEPRGDTVDLRVTFFSDILPAEQAQILLMQFDAVFCDLAQHAEGNDGGLLTTRPELFAILPAQEPELKSDIRLLHEFVEVSAQTCPEKVALEFVTGFDDVRPVSRMWTYKELDDNGNKVAHMLSEYVNAGDIVAVCFDKCPEAHFAMLGILKAGCALLALDPGAPSSRKEFILQDSGASVLLTDKPRSLDMDFGGNVPVVVVHEENLSSVSAVQPKLRRPLTSQDRSYCLYTSGTTGTPKGCEITHENAVQAMLAFQKLFEGHWDSDSKWLQFASYHFDVSVLEQYWTWSVGITLVAAPRDVILEDLAGTISRLDITHIDLTPSLARLLHPDDVPSLCRGVFITGGEQLKQEILDVWGPKHVIHNFYGPTEATIGVTTFPCVPINGRSSNIGRQFANVGSYVLRPGTDTPILRGGVGELCVSGTLVGKGYLNRDELTAERFPTLKMFKERVYRTGDLVRVLHDGCFDFLGRADDQVKLRGQRLEIGEINHCIRSGVDVVTDVVTLVIRNDKQQKDLLVSFVVTAHNHKSRELQLISGDEASGVGQKVQRACRDSLPGYMVPTYVLLLNFIPLSPNNKAEVKELKAFFNKLSPEQLVGPSATSKADLGEVGKKISRALSTMAGVSQGSISSATNIFELGIDSISVLRLVRALKRENLSQATPALILRHPVVSDLVHALKSSQKPVEGSNGVLEARQAVEACQHRHRGAVCRELGIGADQIEYIAPCSALQQGMISRSKTDGSEGAYFNAFRFRLAEGVDLVRLKSAWDSLVRENSVLRTKFVSTIDGYVQVALKSLEISWNQINLQATDDLHGLLADHRTFWVEKNIENIHQPLEFLIIKHGEEHSLVVHIFHAIYDANSLDLMIDKLAGIYYDEEEQHTAPKFLDALLHGPLKNHSLSKSFWTGHLEGADLAPLRQIAETPSSQSLSLSRQIPFDGLEKVRKKLGVTQQAIVQALWSSVMQQYYKSHVTFGIIVSGRSIELDGVEKTIGPLFNTVPYHHRVTQGQSWSSAIRQCHEFNTAILPFQHTALRDVQKWCSAGRPLFSTLFSFQRASSMSKAAKDLWEEAGSDVNPDYPLAFEATLLPDDVLQVLVVTQKDIADEKALIGLLDEFDNLARAVVENVDSLVSSVPGNGTTAGSQQATGKGISDTAGRSLSKVATSFDWEPEAQIIRKHFALLADIEESSVNPGTTLLELGLDSIDTIKLSARLRRADILLSNSELIKGQSIENFMVILQDKQAGRNEVHDSGYSSEAEDPSLSLSKHLAENDIDLTNVQQVLLPTPLQDSMVSEMIQSEFQRYFNHDVLELSPDVDVERLKQAWMTVIKSSPILRTYFVEVKSPMFDVAYAQLIRKNHNLEFCDFEIKSFDEVSSIQEQARVKAQEGQGHSNLLQINFAKFKQRTFVILSIAHALYDGWSLGLLHQDVEAAYHGTFTPRETYTGYLGEILRSSTDNAQNFWSEYVSDAEPTLFPARREAVDSRVSKAEASLNISASAVKTFCKRHAVSQQAVAQACWAAVLATHCQQLDVTFGVVLSGRETEASEAMLFPTMNTVPVRAVFYGSVSNFLRYVQDNITSISQFQHFPLRKIQGLVRNRQGGLFNTLFILQKSNSDADRLTDSDGPLLKSVQGSSAVEYPVCIEMEVVGDNVIWRTSCEHEYLSTDETSQLLRELESVLNFLVKSADENVLKFSDDGVSVCGMASFRPSEPPISDHNQPEQVDENENEQETWNFTEQTIRDVLAEMSGVEQASISKSHNLYHLGLDSISAIKVSSALRKQGVTVTVREMVQAASIKHMAAKASQSSSASSSETVTASDSSNALVKTLKDIKMDDLLESAEIDATDVEATLPATAMQTHMLSVWQNTNGTVFFPEFRYRLSGTNDRTVIETAWKTLVNEQPMLRTVFSATGSKRVPFIQVVLRPGSKTDSRLVLFNACQQKDDSWLISLKIHHALYDGISLPLLINRFRHLLHHDTVPAESGDSTLLRWNAHIASSLDASAMASRRTFWTTYLEGVKTSRLELRGGPARHERVSLLRRGALPDMTHLKALCAENGLGIQAVFIAAYAKVLASLSGREREDSDVVFGVYLANRDAHDQRLPYPTLCLVPLRVRVPCEFRLSKVAGEIQRDLHQISAAENISVGLWEVEEWTGVVIESFVNFLSLPDEPEDGRGQNTHSGDIRLDELGFDETTESIEKHVVKGPSQLSWLEKNSVRDAYPGAVDVEASLQGSRGLDIGVFGPGEKLGDDGAEELVQMMIDTLSS